MSAKCTDCKGSGNGWPAKTPEGDWIDMPCPTCGGRGFIDPPYAIAEEPCPTCTDGAQPSAQTEEPCVAVLAEKICNAAAAEMRARLPKGSFSWTIMEKHIADALAGNSGEQASAPAVEVK